MKTISLMLTMTVALHAAALTREGVVRNAGPFLGLRWSPGARNVLNYCKSPVWIQTTHGRGSQVTGMPYCWGGNSTVREFQDGLAASGYAGNRCTSSSGNNLNYRPRTFGVDCSGLVSQIYEIGEKLGTYQIRDRTQLLRNGSTLRKGDLFVKAGDHVAVFVDASPKGPTVIESVGGYWRVVRRQALWKEFEKYELRRYSKLQDAGFARVDKFSVPSKVKRYSKFTVTLTLKEVEGFDITFDEVVLGVFSPYEGPEFLLRQPNVRVGKDSTVTLTFKTTAKMQPGLYKIDAGALIESKGFDLRDKTGNRPIVSFVVH